MGFQGVLNMHKYVYILYSAYPGMGDFEDMEQEIYDTHAFIFLTRCNAVFFFKWVKPSQSSAMQW